MTHDVEGKRGLDRCRQLVNLELSKGIRSSFGFVPEGEYLVPPNIRSYLTDKGFDVLVHDLHHDGKLYDSERNFLKKALRINGYLQDWQASGFRSGLMHHNLEWLKVLNIAYDSSTFDCDPFEPQSDGVETIFPFWVSRNDGTGFVEFPYTLVQDFSLFVILQEANIDIWKRKLDWIAEHGGMALLNTHPDYMNFDEGIRLPYRYPATFYAEFIDYVKSRYANKYWHATLREVAQYIRTQQKAVSIISKPSAIKTNGRVRKKIWIDLVNTLHVQLFEPIIEELKKQGHSVLVTACDAFQIIDLADQKSMEFISVGHHYGRNRIAKTWGLFYRAMQLAPIVMPYSPDLAILHGARSQIFLCNLLKIKSVLLTDYEYGKFVPTAKPSWVIVPEAMSCSVNGDSSLNIRRYPGTREDVYVPYFKPDRLLAKELGLNDQDIVVTVRPPATEAHYQNPAGEELFYKLMERLLNTPLIKVVLLPRNKKQQSEIIEKRPNFFSNGKTVIPPKAINGLNLIWNSDLVVTGGGTMNREAAAMNVPVYSIFRDPMGSIDKYLEASGKLKIIGDDEDVRNKIKLVKRSQTANFASSSNKTLESILNHINEILAL
jgi:hypothetical protein